MRHFDQSTFCQVRNHTLNFQPAFTRNFYHKLLNINKELTEDLNQQMKFLELSGQDL